MTRNGQHEECPKCGWVPNTMNDIRSFKIEHHPERRVHTEYGTATTNPEYLWFNCQCCGYGWSEDTNDRQAKLEEEQIIADKKEEELEKQKVFIEVDADAAVDALVDKWARDDGEPPKRTLLQRMFGCGLRD